MPTCNMLDLGDNWFIEHWVSSSERYPIVEEHFLVHKCLDDVPNSYVVATVSSYTEEKVRGYGTVTTNEGIDPICMACKKEAPDYCVGYLALCKSTNPRGNYAGL